MIKQTSLPGAGEALIIAGGAPWVYSPDTGTIWRLHPDGSGVAAEIKLPGGPAPAGTRTGRELALVVLRPGEGFACF